VEDSEDSQRVNGLTRAIKNGLDSISTYLRVTGAQKIIRRYFAMNAFDGAMTSLGVVMGSWFSGIATPASVISVILTSGVAMMVSGFSGTYMTESAERNHSLNELEEPFLASIPAVIPFLLPSLAIQTMFIASSVASLLTLFALGVYLGTISGENILYSGAKMVVSGIAVAIIALLLNAH